AQRGGLVSFFDLIEPEPTIVEWKTRMWWVHNEALVALVMLFDESRDSGDLDLFQNLTGYTFEYFPDHQFGEWFGYLDESGQYTHSYKGGPYKGCFHVPRCLLWCSQTLLALSERS